MKSVVTLGAVIATMSATSGAAWAFRQTIDVNGGGALSMTVTDSVRRCGRQSDNVVEYTDFLYSLDTVTNPNSVVLADFVDHPCVVTRTARIGLQSGCEIAFNPEDGATLNCPGRVGYAGPKYIVVGVTYVPPGPSSFVKYSTTQSFGTTTSLSNSFASGVSWSLSLGTSISAILGWFNGNVTATQSSTATQTVASSSSATINLQNEYDFTVMGTQNAFAPVDHDHDIIWLWLNPLQIFTVYPQLPGFPPVVTWNGYGFDMSDQPAMDIWHIEVGYLNGDFGPLPFTDASVLGRSWASRQVFGPGDGPGLTNADFANILRADPFASPSYQVTLSTTASPVTTTDGRFTIAGGVGSPQNFVYRQPAPGSSPTTQTLSNMYSTSSSLGMSSTYETQTSFGLDVSISPLIFQVVNANLKRAWTFTETHQASTMTTNTKAQMASLSITGPPCGSSAPPCNPVYSGPVEFDVYQDNIFGTFMFNPVR